MAHEVHGLASSIIIQILLQVLVAHFSHLLQAEVHQAHELHRALVGLQGGNCFIICELGVIGSVLCGGSSKAHISHL